MTIYHAILKESDQNGPVFLDENISRYIDVFYNKKTTNWFMPAGQREKMERAPAR